MARLAPPPARWPRLLLGDPRRLRALGLTLKPCRDISLSLFSPPPPTPILYMLHTFNVLVTVFEILCRAEVLKLDLSSRTITDRILPQNVYLTRHLERARAPANRQRKTPAYPKDFICSRLKLLHLSY